MSKGQYNSDTYRRRTIRLPKHDYTWTGAYFVTIRAAQYEPVFDVPELRKILEETWQALPKRFPGVALDEFIIMPDHVHLLITPGRSCSLERAMQFIKGGYSYRVRKEFRAAHDV